MKLRVFVAATLVALAVPAGASAGITKYGGTIAGGGEINFTLVKRSKTNIFVRTVNFKNVPADCANNQQALLNVTLGGKIPVDSRRRFKARGQSTVQPINNSKIAGRFSPSFKRASGVMRLWGNYFDGQGGTTFCDTELENWSVKRGG